MELGQRIRAARLEAGLSQRQLCGDTITRNMLSQIENGSARPSMDTLSYLAGQLEKPISYFLEEDVSVSPNHAAMENARNACAAGKWEGVLTSLANYRSPDATFDWEMGLLRQLARLQLAQQAMADGKLPYARHLLQQQESTPYDALLDRERATLTARLDPQMPLPDVDEVLLLKARQALNAQDHARAAAYLDAADRQDSHLWQLLRGEVCFALEQYREAARHLVAAEEAYPQAVLSKLEQCYLQLEDYKMAYLYACKQR